MSAQAINRLINIMGTLRDAEKGCNWDIEQTYESLVPHTLEEAYEVADCIERDDLGALPGELGDLLFQVVFYAEIGKEQGRFDFEDIATLIADKLERRHPHVFGEEANSARSISAEEQTKRWEAIKAKERLEDNSGSGSVLDNVPLNLPALVRAEKLQKRAARVGFDWPSIDGVREKLQEEIKELDEAYAVGDAVAIEEEFGDVLFSVVNLGRFMGTDAETALRRGTQKFTERFRYIERELVKNDLKLEDQSLKTLEALWQQAKSHKKNRAPKHP